MKDENLSVVCFNCTGRTARRLIAGLHLRLMNRAYEALNRLQPVQTCSPQMDPRANSDHPYPGRYLFLDFVPMLGSDSHEAESKPYNHLIMLLIRKYDHRNNLKVHYEGRLVKRDEHSLTANAEWTSPTVRLGYVTFDAGDIFIETFFDNRWYNIFKITAGPHSANPGMVKGWYANISRPARFLPKEIEWDDLALDVWMWPNGNMQILDEHEFEDIKPDITEMEQRQALIALEEVKDTLRDEWRGYANDTIAQLLKKRRWTLGTAESCTGGLISDTLTDRAGCSDYFLGAVVSYANSIKQGTLGVSPETLNTVGAVSQEAALEMARGVRRTLQVDVGVSATGIAGPGGGSADKPVGLVYVGYSSPDADTVRKFVWPHDRLGNKRATADAALKLLMELLAMPVPAPEARPS